MGVHILYCINIYSPIKILCWKAYHRLKARIDGCDGCCQILVGNRESLTAVDVCGWQLACGVLNPAVRPDVFNCDASVGVFAEYPRQKITGSC